MNHYLTIDDGWGELRLKLVCTATPDSPCRMRPSDDRETWNDGDPDLTAGVVAGRAPAVGRGGREAHEHRVDHDPRLRARAPERQGRRRDSVRRPQCVAQAGA